MFLGVPDTRKLSNFAPWNVAYISKYWVSRFKALSQIMSENMPQVDYPLKIDAPDPQLMLRDGLSLSDCVILV